MGGWTKGPWRIGEWGKVVTPSGETLLLTGVALTLNSAAAEAIANRNLVAEAPAMAEALEKSAEDISSAIFILEGASEPYSRLQARLTEIRAILTRIKGA